MSSAWSPRPVLWTAVARLKVIYDLWWYQNCWCHLQAWCCILKRCCCAGFVIFGKRLWFSLPLQSFVNRLTVFWLRLHFYFADVKVESIFSSRTQSKSNKMHINPRSNENFMWCGNCGTPTCRAFIKLNSMLSQQNLFDLLFLVSFTTPESWRRCCAGCFSLRKIKLRTTCFSCLWCSYGRSTATLKTEFEECRQGKVLTCVCMCVYVWL